MKIRNGFVSNSSSSSFVVSLKGLDPSVKSEISRLARIHNDSSCDGYLSVGKNFVFGRISMHDESGLAAFVKENVAKENWEHES